MTGGLALIGGLGFSDMGGEWDMVCITWAWDDDFRWCSSRLNFLPVFEFGEETFSSRLNVWKVDKSGAFLFMLSPTFCCWGSPVYISELEMFLGMDAAFFSVPWLDLAKVSAALRVGLSLSLPSCDDGEFDPSGRSNTRSGVCLAEVFCFWRGKLIRLSDVCCSSSDRTSDMISAKTLSILVISSLELSRLDSLFSGLDVCLFNSSTPCPRWNRNPSSLLVLSRDCVNRLSENIDWLMRFPGLADTLTFPTTISWGSFGPSIVVSLISVSSRPRGAGALIALGSRWSPDFEASDNEEDEVLFDSSEVMLFLSSGLQN